MHLPRIIAIGGGRLAELDTLPIDREIVRFAGMARPRVLFIPTASDDAPEYCAAFSRVYGTLLRCPTEQLLLVREAPAAEAIREKIEAAEIIYVGGGNTLKMMQTWREQGVDSLLRQAAQDGKILCGISAGANCWFQWGCSDSQKFSSPDDWNYIQVSGLGLIPAAACPHYHRERREQPFAEMIALHGGTGVALDDGAALLFDGGGYRLLQASDQARGYVVRTSQGIVTTTEIAASDAYASVEELLR